MIIHSETPNFWVLDKPVGIPINDTESQQGLMTLFKTEFNLTKVHPVHRLDKETSGLCIVAKHSEANKVLSSAFQNKNVRKFYIAITRYNVGSKPKKKQGWIKGDMAASRNGNWKLLKTSNNPAQTQFYSFPLFDRHRFCVLRPITGKTHQLRVAMKAIAMPILGDSRYGDDDDRMYLHAYRIGFNAFGKQYDFAKWPTEGRLFDCTEVNVFKEKLGMSDFIVWP